MKILIDDRWKGNTGIGRVYQEVAAGIPNYVEITNLEPKIGLGSPLSPFVLGLEVNKNKGDVFYSPGFMPPFNSKVPFVITIHDLLHVYYHSKFHRFYFKKIIAHIAKSAKKVITVSEYTKTELLKHTSIKKENIEVIYNGVSDKFRLNKEKLVLDNPYFLYIGNRRSHKNIETLIHAFATASIPKHFELALSGDSDPVIQKIINRLGIHDRIRFLGKIAEEDICKVYKGAFGLLFIPLMEGFGLPLLEAMASGTPVITSNITSLPEIAGDAAIKVNPFNIEDIAHGIEKLSCDSGLCQELVELGYERSNNFTWKICTDNTWNVILNT